MKQWFQKLAYKIAEFMYGRYGGDNLNLFFTVLSWIFLLISLLPIPFFGLFSIVGLALCGWAIFRSLSRNIAKRRAEYDRFLRITAKPRNAWRLHQNKKRDKKTHCYFKCPKCKAVLRVPLGKGSIIVTCPKCGERIEKKT